jgi:hypothetical protein
VRLRKYRAPNAIGKNVNIYGALFAVRGNTLRNPISPCNGPTYTYDTYVSDTGSSAMISGDLTLTESMLILVKN